MSMQHVKVHHLNVLSFGPFALVVCVQIPGQMSMQGDVGASGMPPHSNRQPFSPQQPYQYGPNMFQQPSASGLQQPPQYIQAGQNFGIISIPSSPSYPQEQQAFGEAGPASHSQHFASIEPLSYPIGIPWTGGSPGSLQPAIVQMPPYTAGVASLHGSSPSGTAHLGARQCPISHPLIFFETFIVVNI